LLTEGLDVEAKSCSLVPGLAGLDVVGFGALRGRLSEGLLMGLVSGNLSLRGELGRDPARETDRETVEKGGGKGSCGDPVSEDFADARICSIVGLPGFEDSSSEY
jgi:hypothetical protein